MTSTQGGVPTPGTGTSAAKTDKRQRQDIVRIVAALIIVIVLIAFVVKNSERVDVSFVFFTAHVRLIWVLLFTAVLGAVADRLFIWRRKKNRAASK